MGVRKLSTSSSEPLPMALLRMVRRSLRAGVGSGESGGSGAPGDGVESKKGAQGSFIGVSPSGEDGNTRAGESGVVVTRLLPWEVEASRKGGPAEEDGRLMPAGRAFMFWSLRELGA